MKTAISIPDVIFQRAEKIARKRKMTRSELYTKAVAKYLEQEHEQSVTERLDELFATDPTTVAPEFIKAQTALLDKEDW